jgi:hypothetical protein
MIRSAYPIRYSFTDLKHEFWAVFYCAAASRGARDLRGICVALPRLSALEPKAHSDAAVVIPTGASVQDEVRMLCDTLGMVEGTGFAIGLSKAFFRKREAEFLVEVKNLVEQRATAVLQPCFLSALARHRHSRVRAAARILNAAVAAELKWRVYTQQRLQHRQESKDKASLLQAVLRRQLAPQRWATISQKFLYVALHRNIVALHRKYTRELTFENVCILSLTQSPSFRHVSSSSLDSLLRICADAAAGLSRRSLGGLEAL